MIFSGSEQELMNEDTLLRLGERGKRFNYTHIYDSKSQFHRTLGLFPLSLTVAEAA